jgi:hypothetical protein
MVGGQIANVRASYVYSSVHAHRYARLQVQVSRAQSANFVRQIDHRCRYHVKVSACVCVRVSCWPQMRQ